MTHFSLVKTKHDEIGRPWYDTTGGITLTLTSLFGLNQLVAERYKAGYDRKERLNQFYILNGRYHLDTCGNCGTVSVTPDGFTSQVPLVITHDDFFKLLNAFTDDDSAYTITTMNGGNLPEANLFCPYCNKGWSIDNCYDSVVYHTTEVFPLVDFVGMTLAEVKLTYGMKSDAVYRMQPDILIRNDTFIDTSPKYPDADEDWKKDIVINKNGWVDKKWLATKCGDADHYVIQNGDEGFFNIWTYFHRECNHKRLAEKEERKLRIIFEKAGFREVKMTEIPNQYYSCETCAPWFDVETKFGTIRIGWRKRVIAISWGMSSMGNLLYLFKDEDVTKKETEIHAWGWDKAEDYLSRIYEELSKRDWRRRNNLYLRIFMPEDGRDEVEDYFSRIYKELTE